MAFVSLKSEAVLQVVVKPRQSLQLPVDVLKGDYPHGGPASNQKMQIRPCIKVRTGVGCVGYELMSKPMHGRSLFHGLIHFPERGVKVKNPLQPSYK